MLKQSALLLCCLILSACASYEAQYRSTDPVTSYPSNKEIEKSFYLIGDAGYSKPGGMSDGLKTARNYLTTQDTQGNYTIFLGDNIYPVGMPPVGAPSRKNSELRLDAQYNAVSDYDGNVIFIPGNHDWYNEGLLGLKRQEDYFESKLKDRKVFKPTKGCPLESIEVSENIQLIILDSQWYLEDWNEHPRINEQCEIKTREKLFIEIELELEKNRDKTIVFAMHHPMFTNGTHGGYFGAKKHLYPTQRNIPLPILSSLVAQIRSQGGVSVQDRYNELYNKLMNRLADITRKNERLVFASGHEHTLQHIERNGLIQILSGSGSKGGFAALGKDGLFSYGGQGFAVYDVFTDGSSWVRYFGVGDNYEPRLLFEKEIFPPTKEYDVSSLPVNFPKTKEAAIYTTDSIQEALYFKTVWGAKYKNAYATMVNAKVGRMDSLYGGIEVIAENSSGDYKSLRLRDRRGNEYRMRSLYKNSLQYQQKIAIDEEQNPDNFQEDDTEVALPDSFNIEFYTATHPYAVMAIPDMAEAIGIFHTTPKLFYIPKQKGLGKYNETFGDELYLISIEPNEMSEGLESFQYPDDVETTDDILIKVREEGEIFVDEQNYIKSRLFNMLIGDWDREPNHWLWAEYFNSDSLNVYVPIPKNNDYAFSSFEGNILDIARSVFGRTIERQVYGEKLNNIKWFNKEGVILDRALLQRSGRAQWTYLAEMIQANITDQLIDEAFLQIPEEVRDESLEEIKTKLKARRDNLKNIANEYYDFLATQQSIEATDGKDYIQITRSENGNTLIEVFKEEGDRREQIIDRTFKAIDTKEVWIYGLDGEDTFVVNGETGSSSIFLRIIGGQENDSYIINNGKNVKVYDHKSKPNTIVAKNGATVRFTDVYSLNTYDYRRQITKTNTPAAALGYNPDEGARIGLQFVVRKDGFQRNPFSQRHQFSGAYYTDIESYELSYEGEFANLQQDRNLNFGLRFTNPGFQVNYFGYGNETTNMETISGFGLDANRVQIQNLTAHVGLLRNSNFGSFFKLQAKFDTYTINSPFVPSVNASHEHRVGATNLFGTLEAIYSYRSYDDPRNPSRGMMFDLNTGITDNLEDVSRVFGFLKTRLGFYNSLSNNDKLVLKTNVQAAFNFDNKFEFYQGIQLGANTGLRGYRINRFTGKSSLVGSADLRYSFNEFTLGLIPLQIGVYGGADLGRVWIPSRSSEKWHNDYGVGFWINGSGGLSATGSLFNSTEGSRASFGFGFSF